LVDWPKHPPVMYDFWSFILLAVMPTRQPISKACHFAIDNQPLPPMTGIILPNY